MSKRVNVDAALRELEAEVHSLREGNAKIWAAVADARARRETKPAVEREADREPPAESLSDPASTRCAWIVAVCLAVLPILVPMLFRAAVVHLSGGSGGGGDASAYPSFAQYEAQRSQPTSSRLSTSSLPPPSSPPPPPPLPSTTPQRASDDPVTYRNGIKFEYHPLRANANASDVFRIKRIVSVRVHERTADGAPSMLARYTSAALASSFTKLFVDAQSAIHSGLVRVEAFCTSPDAPPEWRTAYDRVQAHLRVVNWHCSHRIVAFTHASIARVDLYECASGGEFLTRTAADIGSAACASSDAISAFCPRANQTGAAVASAAAAAAAAAADAGVLDLSTLQPRRRPANASSKVRGEYAPDECQDMQHDVYRDHFVRAIVAGPRLEHLARSGSVSVLHTDPPVLLIDNFLSDLESAYLVRTAEQIMHAQSGVVGATEDESRTQRSSFSAIFAHNETKTLQSIEARAMAISGLSIAEELQVVRYQSNQHYVPHLDWFERGPGQGDALHQDGQRALTLFVYLNNLPTADAGGCTGFPLLGGKAFRPRRNSALLFYNVRANGVEDTRVLHSGQPVRGDAVVKYGLNIWLREPALVGPSVKC